MDENEEIDEYDEFKKKIKKIALLSLIGGIVAGFSELLFHYPSMMWKHENYEKYNFIVHMPFIIISYLIYDLYEDRHTIIKWLKK